MELIMAEHRKPRIRASRNRQEPGSEYAKAGDADDTHDTKKGIAQTGITQAMVAARHQGKRRA
jgi:hypothetical protein